MGFWDQVKQQAGTLKAKTAEKTQEWRLQTEINDIRAKIQKKHTSLGVMLYQMYKEDRGNYDALLPVCREIEALEQDIAEIEEKIAELKIKPGVCPKCNHENSPEARFCASCGTPLEQVDDKPEPMDEPQIIVCPECNAEQTEEANFCAHCGHKLA